MTPQAILAELWQAGIALRLTDDGANLTAPAGRLTDAHRLMVREHKPELIALLQDAHATAIALIEAAKRACAHNGDGPAAREQMRQECLATPRHLLADLLAHLNETYPKKDPS